MFIYRYNIIYIKNEVMIEGRERERGRESRDRLTVWSIDGSSLTGTEADGRESVSVFSVRRGDKTVMGKK